MNDKQDDNDLPVEDAPLPSQVSPIDTSNWEGREFITPSGRVVIETNQDEDDMAVIQE